MLGKSDLHLEVEVAERLRVDLVRHTLAFHNDPLVWLYDFVCGALDLEAVVVEVRDGALESQQRLFETDLQVHKQIVADPLKSIMGLLLDCEYEVASLHVRDLFAFLLVKNVITVVNTLLDRDVEKFAFVYQPPAVAFVALGGHGGTLATALRTRLLHLHLHNSHVDHLKNNALAFALGALLQLAVLGTRAPAVIAVNVPVDVHFPGAASVHFLEGHVDIGPGSWTLFNLAFASAEKSSFFLKELTFRSARGRRCRRCRTPGACSHRLELRRLG